MLRKHVIRYMDACILTIREQSEVNGRTLESESAPQVNKCRVRPANQGDINGLRVALDRSLNLKYWRVSFPHGTVIDERYRIYAEGHVLDVTQLLTPETNSYEELVMASEVK